MNGAHYTHKLINAERIYFYGSILIDGCNYSDKKLQATLKDVTITAKNAVPVSC